MTVSVIVPNYNHAKYLKERIESILNQTYRDFELIILDDCSTDNSKEIIKDYTSRYPFISSYFNERNSGSPFTQWDSGVNKAKGELVWIAESDDFADPTFLEKASAIMLNHENVGLVYCNSRIIDIPKQTEYLSSELSKHLNGSKWLNDYFNKGKNEISEYLYLNCTIHNVSGVLFRKSAYIEAGLADCSMKYCGDWFIYIRILLISDIAYISEPLNTLRLHSYSTFNNYFRSNTFLKEVIRVYLYVIQHILLSPKKIFLMVYSVLYILRERIKCALKIPVKKNPAKSI
jgi:glycosyltransferase involved in cell wall biosynthesis